MSYALHDTMFFGRGTLTTATDTSTKAGYSAVISSEVAAIGADNGAGVVGVIIDGGLGSSGDLVAIGFGHCLALCGAAIASGDLISTDSTFRFITAASGDAAVGRALSKTAAAGDVVEIFLYGPVDQAVA